MANSLGRDKLWNPEIWAEIDQAVMAEVGRLRVAQKVFPAQQVPNAANVSADELVPLAQTQDTLMIQEGITKPFIELWVEFALTPSQVDNEATLHTARTLARLAARSVAKAEDLFSFQGQGARLPSEVGVTNKASAKDGLLKLKGAPGAITIPTVQSGSWGENTFKHVVEGIGKLTDAGHPGPYALILEPAVFADSHAPIAGTLTTVADRISPLVEGRFYSTGALPSKRGLLVSLGGEPTTIYVAQDTITAHTQEDRQGNYRFRVFERVQTVAREAKACQSFEFK